MPQAVAGVVTKINSIFTATVMGICQSCQPIFGYNYGAGNHQRVKETFRLTLFIATAVSVASEVLFQLFPHQILEIFQRGDTLYLEFGTAYLRIFLGATFANGVTVLVSNFFPSIGKAKEGTLASLSRQVLFQLPLILLFPRLWGLDGVLYAGPVADALAAALCAVLAVPTLKQLDAPPRRAASRAAEK